jgi:antitoxin MazE
MSLRRVCMKTKIQKWGNSPGIRFSKEIMEEARISVGDEVEVHVDDNAIIVKPVQVIRGKYTIKALFSKKVKKGSEIEWGRPQGCESTS